MKKQFGWFQTLIFQAKNGRLDKEKLEFGARKTKRLFEEQKRTEPGQTHQKYLWIFIFYSQKFNLLASHRSHKSHRGASLRPRLSASPSVFSRMAHASLRCVLREICEICVKLNHLCELFLVRLPWN